VNHILLISRLSTQNAGNEALSKEFIDLFLDVAGQAEVRAMDRYPQHLSWVTMTGLLRGTDKPEKRFDDFVDALLQHAKGPGQAEIAPKASRDLVKLDLTARELPGWLKRIKRAIGFRKRLARLGLMGRDGLYKLGATLDWADLLVWNPAGEIHPTGDSNEVMRLLMVMRAAQRLGKRTMVVNHSLEIADPMLKRLIAHVYTNASQLCVRDKRSLEVALSLGVDPARVREVPDMVFLAAATAGPTAAPAPEERAPTGAIGLAINGLEAHVGGAGWEDLMRRLAKHQRPVFFLSNAMNHDLPFAEALQKNHALTVLPRQPGYEEIRSFYRDLSVLVSSRLHSSILALCEGVPVVTIEPSSFKLTGIFQQLDYPLPTERLQSADWVDRVASHVDAALADRAQLSEFGLLRARRKAAEVRQAYLDVLSELAARPVEEAAADAATRSRSNQAVPKFS